MESINNIIRSYRIGMIVPSSNTTMETEMPELLSRQTRRSDDRFTFHSSRLRLMQVTPEALEAMNSNAAGAVDTLCDAQVDCLMYACLVAAMFGGKSSVTETTANLAGQAHTNGRDIPVITSAGALVNALQAMNSKNVAMITPYKKELTARVATTIGEYGINVVRTHSLEVVDNASVGRLDPQQLIAIARNMDLSDVDTLIVSACVQMPSLPVLDIIEQAIGKPVVSAATASAYMLLNNLGITPNITNAGQLLRSN